MSHLPLEWCAADVKGDNFLAAFLLIKSQVEAILPSPVGCRHLEKAGGLDRFTSLRAKPNC